MGVMMIPYSLPVLDALHNGLNLPHTCIEKAIHDAQSPDGYTDYLIPKGNGKMRHISAPSEELKVVQSQILFR